MYFAAEKDEGAVAGLDLICRSPLGSEGRRIPARSKDLHLFGFGPTVLGRAGLVHTNLHGIV